MKNGKPHLVERSQRQVQGLLRHVGVGHGDPDALLLRALPPGAAEEGGEEGALPEVQPVQAPLPAQGLHGHVRVGAALEQGGVDVGGRGLEPALLRGGQDAVLGKGGKSIKKHPT